MEDQDERCRILGELCYAVSRIEQNHAFARLIPEVRTNLAYGMPNASSLEDVAAIGGRITIVDGLPRAAGYPAFGTSKHLASAILELMKSVPGWRASCNILYSPELGRFLEGYCRDAHLCCIGVDREDEPCKTQENEGRSVPWKVQEALRLAGGKPPDVLYDVGGFGKEPMTLVFAESPLSLVGLVLHLAEAFSEEA